MTTITIALDDEQLEQLRRTAGDLGLSVEQTVQQSISSYLERRATVREACDFVLAKNAELYRRLA